VERLRPNSAAAKTVLHRETKELLIGFSAIVVVIFAVALTFLPVAGWLQH
jgi:hypothetical protein